MIHDHSTPHRVFKISELTRIIAQHLVLIDNKSAVSLACVSRYLEEPALSSLWETQESFCTLLMVLPEGILHPELPGRDGYMLRIMGDPSQEAWTRVQRYASWMRQVSMSERPFIAGDTLDEFRLKTPAGGWFPVLQGLHWHITEASRPSYIDLFLSPHLREFSISTPLSWNGRRVSRGLLEATASALYTLPASTLQFLFADFRGCDADPHSTYFKGSLSSVVLRCGPSLTGLISRVPLSDAAINHLIQLPHLHTWRIEGPPPDYSPSPLPFDFPPLTDLTLGGGAGCGWVSLFRRLENGVSALRDVTPLSKMKKSLKILNVEDAGFLIDASFASKISTFRNLVHLGVWGHEESGEDQCTFGLSDESVTELATALPRLEYLFLGRPCSENSCATTVACLLQISVHCVKLRTLEIHFNTTNIVDDFRNISKDLLFQELRSLPKCTLTKLFVGQMPLTLDEPGFGTVVDGMTAIFPSLERCLGSREAWIELSRRITRFRQT